MRQLKLPQRKCITLPSLHLDPPVSMPSFPISHNATDFKHDDGSVHAKQRYVNYDLSAWTRPMPCELLLYLAWLLFFSDHECHFQVETVCSWKKLLRYFYLPLNHRKKNHVKKVRIKSDNKSSVRTNNGDTKITKCSGWDCLGGVKKKAVKTWIDIFWEIARRNKAVMIQKWWDCSTI